MDSVIEGPLPADPEALVGTFRRFRSGGPSYAVLAVDAERGTAKILVLDGGEELDYPIGMMIDDNEE